MQLTNVLTVAFLLVGTSFAVPSAAKPPKPNKPVIVVQQANQCGNNVTPYCCDSDNGSYTNCNAIKNSDQCNTVIVCCNAVDSNQKCVASG